MSTICRPCETPVVCLEDLDKYNLQDEIFPFILVCPPNFFCGGSNVVFLLCCDGNTLRVDIPRGSTAATRNSLIGGMVAECERRRAFCGIEHPPQPPTYYYNAPQSCTIYCPDGTPFTYTVPAGVFLGDTQEEADAAAKAYACEQAPNFLLCLGDFNACWCAGTASTGTISIQSNHPPFKVSVTAGSLPSGMNASTTANSIIISGTPTLPGNYSFVLQVVDDFGNKQARNYALTVIEFTTASIPNYEVGVPYSFQLVAAGGSGNYAWRIVSGVLPDGLGFNSQGLISGTPTGLSSGTNVTFEVVDINCEAVMDSFFVPRISMSTIARTEIRTKRGWAKWTGYDGILYKRATFSGEQTQIAFPTGNNSAEDDIQCAGAKYVYSGTDEIDIYGRKVTQHSKVLTVMCAKQPPALFSLAFVNQAGEAFVRPVINPVNSILLGYCWNTDPLSCSSCNADDDTWASLGDRSVFGATDQSTNMFSPIHDSVTPFVKTLFGQNIFAGSTNIQRRETFPTNNGNGTYVDSFAFVQIIVDGSWSVTLSQEYTDADAQNSAIHYITNSNTSENRPNYLDVTYGMDIRVISSRFTTVTYALSCTDLVIGRDYIARVTLTDSSGLAGTVSIPFTAAAKTHLVTGSVPVPASGHTIKVSNPRIAFG